MSVRECAVDVGLSVCSVLLSDSFPSLPLILLGKLYIKYD